MMRFFALVAAAGLVAAAAVVHGLRTERWGRPADIDAAVARLAEAPEEVGEWKGAALEVDRRQMAMTGAAGWLSRRYVRSIGNTSDEVTLLVLCGRPGPISLHSPEICFPGAGYVEAGTAEKQTLPAGADAAGSQLAKGRFVKAGPSPDSLVVYWAWKAQGAWSAPDEARVAFAGASVLYKIYVVRRSLGKEDGKQKDPCVDFLQEFLPELDRRLSPS